MSNEDSSNEDAAFLPLGYSQEEGGGASLSAVKGIGPECPKCEEGYIVTITKNSSWGRPSSPATSYCRECGTSFTLGLKEQND